MMRLKSPIRHVLSTMIGILMMASATAQEVTEMQGPNSVVETYDAWTVQCVNAVEGEQQRRVCQMSQELLQPETRQRVLLVAITKEGDGAKATLIMPFGLLLREGFRIEIAEKELLRGAYRTCLPTGCLAEIDLPASAVEELGASGDAATVLMTANTGQQIRTNVSLKGFTAAYRRLSELAAEG